MFCSKLHNSRNKRSYRGFPMSAIFSTKIGDIEKFLINPFLNYPIRESISEDPLAVEIIT